ncbi:hypothetical protein K1719_012745 [Acacia pycnantha]|nr:hypothetical protein K1719_012745 [Acacia pycnantha]
MDRKKPVFPEDSQKRTAIDDDAKTNDNSIMNRLKSPISRTQSKRRPSSESIDKDKISSPSMMNRLKSTYGRVSSVKEASTNCIWRRNATNSSNKQMALSLRLSSHQITLLLSSIWAQSLSPRNVPENFQAMAHTYSLVLLVARRKNSSNEALIQSFQLAFTLRSIWVEPLNLM